MAGRHDEADALHYDYRALYERCGLKLKILGNLPYYLTSPFIFRLLTHRSCIAQMLIMVQKEVADRITAEPGTRTYRHLEHICSALLPGITVPDRQQRPFLSPSCG